MALALVTRELFSGYATLSSGSPGNLGTVVGSDEFRLRPIGPNVSGMSTDPAYGWSSLLRGVGTSQQHYRVLPSGEKESGGFSCWYRLEHIANDATNGTFLAMLRSDLTAGTEPLSALYLGPSNQVTRYFPYQVTSTATTALPVIPLYSWFQLACAWSQDTGSTVIDWLWYCPDAGVETLTLISRQTHNLFGVYYPARMDSGSWPTAGTTSVNAFTGRYALPSYYTLAARSEISGIASAAELPTKRRVVYTVRPGDENADDASDGILAADRCWETLARVKIAFKTGELLGSSRQWLNTTTGQPVDTDVVTKQAAVDFIDGIEDGTIVVDPINGSTVNLDSDLDYIFDDRSTWWDALGRQDQHGIKFTSAVAIATQKGVRPSVVVAGTWTQPDAGTYPNLWTITLPSEFTSCGLWEITSSGAVLATQQIASAAWDTNAMVAVNATAGRFWHDGEDLYYHPLSGANPNTDNRVRRATDNVDDTTVVFENYGSLMENLVTTQTGAGVWNGSSSAVFAVGGYGFTARGNYSAMKNIIAERFGKHGFGDFTPDGVSAWLDCTTRGAIITSILSVTPHVIYRANGLTTGTVVLRRWDETGRFEVIATGGFQTTVSAEWNSIFAHSESSDQLECVIFDDCQLLGTILFADAMPSRMCILINTYATEVTVTNLVDLGEYVRTSTADADAVVAAIKADADLGTAGLIADAATAATEVGKIQRLSTAIAAGASVRRTKVAATSTTLDETLGATP